MTSFFRLDTSSGSKLTACRFPTVMQAAVPVLDRDTEATLAARILAEEHRIYSQAIALISSGRWHIEGRRVIAE